jgi:hypothetical protein
MKDNVLWLTLLKVSIYSILVINLNAAEKKHIPLYKGL